MIGDSQIQFSGQATIGNAQQAVNNLIEPGFALKEAGIGLGQIFVLAQPGQPQGSFDQKLQIFLFEQLLLPVGLDVLRAA